MHRMSEPPAKKRCRTIEEDVKVFQNYWTEKFCVIEKDNKVLCIFCFKTVICKTSSVKRRYESVRHNISNKTKEEQNQLISSHLKQIKKQADNFINFIPGRFISNLVAASFKDSKVIAQHGNMDH